MSKISLDSTDAGATAMGENTTIPGRLHYELLAGSLIRVPIFDDDGNVIANESHVLRENICVYIEGKDEVKTIRGVRIAVK